MQVPLQLLVYEAFWESNNAAHSLLTLILKKAVLFFIIIYLFPSSFVAVLFVRL